MRYIPRPQFNAPDVLALCVPSVGDVDVQLHVESSREDILSDIAAFEHRVANNESYLVPKRRCFDNISNKQMKLLYKDGMVASQGGARHVYTAIRKLVKFNTCPLCGQNSVSTLDHYLPQSRFCTLVVTPLNLIPACGDCNRFKLARVFGDAADQTLHPYFDNFTQDQWLFAQLAEAAPCALVFFTQTPQGWPELDGHRVEKHFRTFKLADLFASNAANELVNIKLAMDELCAEGGAATVRVELERRARSNFAAHKNSWQTAMYQALAQSDWYCGGGYQNV